MCGIAGWIDWHRNISDNLDILEEMQESLSHRGPDDCGDWYSKRAGFAHRRLIVIDPEGGKQPMLAQQGRKTYVLVYNGELYNTEDIRQILLNKGYTFKGHSDTEVLLQSYLEWGERCVDYFNGIFAFAVWDVCEEKLFIARDRIGVKPLFYARLKNGLVFASEIKAILKHPEIEPCINSEGLAEVLIMGPGRTPGNGIFKDIAELKPGFSLTYQKNSLQLKRYWELISKEHTDNLIETVKKVRYLFTDSVKRQLISDVPICTLLSGGLDSSAISAVASRELKENGYRGLDTYSVDYEGNERFFKANDFQPETDNYWAAKVAETINSKHHNVVLDNHLLSENLREGVYARDLPGMADIDVSLYLLAKEIKKEFVVAVSGECADEIFGGYPWFYREEALKADIFPWSRRYRERIALLSREVKERISPEKYLIRRYQEALAEVPALAGEDEKNARMREMFYLNLTRWMPVLLDRKDRMSMYTGLEIRVPFCDHRLVEYLWNIPWEMKSYGKQRKGLLREALKGILPESVRNRPKNPYPKTFNPLYYHKTKDLLIDILNNKNKPLNSVIDTEGVLNLTKKKGDFDIPWFGQLMRLPQLFAYLIQLNIWLEDYHVRIS